MTNVVKCVYNNSHSFYQQISRILLRILSNWLEIDKIYDIVIGEDYSVPYRLMGKNLTSRARHYVALSAAEEHLLDNLQADEVVLNAKETLANEQDPANLLVVKSGWLCSFTESEGKKRQMLAMHCPGDIVGFANLTMRHPFRQLMGATGAVVAPFSKHRLNDVFIQSPRLTALLFSFAMLDQVVLLDRIRTLGRCLAVEKVTYLLLDVQARLQIHIAHGELETFEVPLTQEMIGDLLGLTNVSVSNALTQLQYEGYISCQRKLVTIHEREKMSAMIDFKNRYADIDTSWFPAH